MRKCSDQTNVEFARELRLQCQRQCVSSNVKTFDNMMDLIVLEKFKNTLPERVATYVAEKEAQNEAEAAVLVDQYELTHKAHSGECVHLARFGQKEIHFTIKVQMLMLCQPLVLNLNRNKCAVITWRGVIGKGTFQC